MWDSAERGPQRRRRRSSDLSSIGSVVEVPVVDDMELELEKEIHNETKNQPEQRLQLATAECCVDSAIENFLALASVCFTADVFILVSFNFTSRPSGWAVLSCVSAILLLCFIVEVHLRWYAFGRSYIFVLSNLAEVVLTDAALALEIVTCVRLLQTPRNSSIDVVTYLTILFCLLLIILRLRRFQDVLIGGWAWIWLGRTRTRTDGKHASDRVLELLRRLRRKYPLTARESQELNWASFLIATKKLYHIGSDELVEDSPRLFEGLDEETTSWLLHTYSHVQINSRAKDPTLGDPDSNSSRTQAQSDGDAQFSEDDSGPLAARSDSELLGSSNSPQQGGGLISRAGFSDSTLLTSNETAESSSEPDSEGSSDDLTVALSVELPSLHDRKPQLLSVETSEQTETEVGSENTLESIVPIVEPGSLLPLSTAAPLGRRKSWTGKILTPRRRPSGGQFEALSEESNTDLKLQSDGGKFMNVPEPPNSSFGRQTSGSRTGIILSDLEDIRNYLLLHSSLGTISREFADHPSKREVREPVSSNAEDPVPLNDDVDEDEEIVDQTARTSASPVNKRFPRMGMRGGPNHLKHSRARTSLPNQAGTTASKIRILAEHARLRSVKWTENEIESVNASIDEWNFDVFELNEFSGGRPLSVVMFAALRKNGMFQAFPKLRKDAVLTFITNIESGYRVENPYHNRIHAADVLQTMHHFLTHDLLRRVVTEQDVLCSLVSSAIHDFQHPGKSNAFLIATGDKLALRYNDRAVLEHMHVSAAFQVMRTKRCDVLRCVGDMEKYLEARETVIQMVLATDMSNHFEGLERFKTEVVQYFEAQNTRNLGAKTSIDSMAALNLAPSKVPLEIESSMTVDSSKEDLPPLSVRRTLLKTSLHCADVSNPAKNPKLCQSWAMLVQEEFFRQGDKERENGLKISMFMDRTKPAFHKCQIGFITIIVKPLFNSYCQFLTSLKPQVDWCLTANLSHWEKKQAEEESSHNLAWSGQTATPPTPSSGGLGGKRTSFRFVSGGLLKSTLSRSNTSALPLVPPPSPSPSARARSKHRTHASFQIQSSQGVSVQQEPSSPRVSKGLPNPVPLHRSRTDYAIDYGDL